MALRVAEVRFSIVTPHAVLVLIALMFCGGLLVGTDQYVAAVVASPDAFV